MWFILLTIFRVNLLTLLGKLDRFNQKETFLYNIEVV